MVATATNKAKATPPVTSRSDFSEGGGFTYPAKLAEGQHEQIESGNWRIRLVFDRLDRQWDDGEPVKQFVNALTTMHNGSDPMWAGSSADVIAESFEAQTGGDLNVLDDDSIAAFIGHAFVLTDEVETDKDGKPRTYTDKNGRERTSYITTCTEYLGADYEYTGKVNVVTGSGAAASATEAQDDAAIVAALFEGEIIAELRMGKALDFVKDCEELAEVKTLFGKSLRGGLVKPKAVLIDALIENGYGTDEDGVFVSSTPE